MLQLVLRRSRRYAPGVREDELGKLGLDLFAVGLGDGDPELAARGCDALPQFDGSELADLGARGEWRFGDEIASGSLQPGRASSR